ncbi:serine/threonine-protein phosphatase PP2A catalytic subunit [Pelomyxa schiedti]|nr:serine/threonine-protein phosphatase PP2A catalytic subunit [Pelomyxa schiedti]
MRGPLRKARGTARSILAQHSRLMSPNYGMPASGEANSRTCAVQESDLPPAPTLEQLRFLTEGAIFLLKKEPNLMTLQFPIAIVGDIHGQLEDLHTVFKLLGSPQHRSFLFLGDYVDLGHHSLQCISLLLALKLLFPSSVTLLRGNHESRQMTRVYGLYENCRVAYKELASWEWLCDVFDCLPLAATIGNKVFAVHGGPSQELPEISDILKLDRFVDSAPVDAGIITDFLWSDPDTRTEDWSASPRGAGFLYGRRACKSFLSRNNLQFIVRSHQLVMDGIFWELDNLVCTIYSCCNYGYRCGNQGAAVVMEECTAVGSTPGGNSSGSAAASTTTVPDVKIVADGTILMREFTWSKLPSYPYPQQHREDDL